MVNPAMKFEEFPVELLVASFARAEAGHIGFEIILRLDPFFLLDDVVEPIIRLHRACLPANGLAGWVNHTFLVPDNPYAGGIRGTIEFGTWTASVVCLEIDFGCLVDTGVSVDLTLSLLFSEHGQRFEDVHVRIPTVMAIDP